MASKVKVIIAERDGYELEYKEEANPDNDRIQAAGVLCSAAELLVSGGSIDPVNSGLSANEGSIYFASDGITYKKTGPGDTDWTPQNKHNQLVERDAANCHPIPAITGLSAELNLLPHYYLHAQAAENIYAGDEVSMDVNGHVQRYPATGGEGNSQFTPDTVIFHAAVFLDYNSNQGIIAWVKSGTGEIYFRTAQGNQDGTITYSTIATKVANGQVKELRVCKIDSGRAGYTWIDADGVSLGIVQNNGISSTPSLGTTRNIDNGTIVDCDLTWDDDKGNLIGVFSSGDYLYNRYCTISNTNVNSPPYDKVDMNSCHATECRCVSESQNIIATTTYNGTSYWVEAKWKKPVFGTGRYDDLTNVATKSDCTHHCGLKVQSGNILSQFKYNDKLYTYITGYSSGSTMNTPALYSDPIDGKWGDLIQTESGTGYTAILTDLNKVEIYEGTIQGEYEQSYISIFSVDSSNDTISALMFGSVFAFGIGFYAGDANKVFLVDSTATRTDHFIGVAPANITQGQSGDIDIALPIVRLPRTYPLGTMYFYGPYKYQIITPNQAVIIIESTIMQSAVL
jgi:hypothetical protein